MKKTLTCLSLALVSQLAFAQGGAVTDPTTNLIFDYDNITQEQAQAELQECQTLAQSTQQPVESSKGSGVRGAAKAAAAGAAIGAISGGSGSDAAKTGAAIGVVGGRVKGNRGAQAAEQQNLESYKTVLRNCMVDKKYVALN
ncbi:glycine zipper family protein [Vibrio paucivorans]